MTLIYDPNGKLISGMLIGDDDNALTIGKGMITNVTGTGPYDFHYNISEVDVTGFKKVNAKDGYDDVSWHQPATTGENTHEDRTGTARFTLRFETQ